MKPSWIIPEARIEHIALAEAGRVYVTRVLDVTATHATILDERNGTTAVVPLAVLRRVYRPAPPPSLRARTLAWWRSTEARREAIAWAVRHPGDLIDLAQREVRRRKVRGAVAKEIEAARKVN